MRRFRLAFVLVDEVTTQSLLVKVFLDERSVVADLFLGDAFDSRERERDQKVCSKHR